jgi:mRNA-degrading endonuclease toxin of MazEF toxin-antitoxin module
MKRFLEWIGVKERLDSGHHAPPYVSERELWWVSFGENIGSEINGKSGKFSRPGLIIKKLAHDSYLIAPCTTQPHQSSRYVKVRLENKDEYICLNQIRTIDYRRLYSRLGKLSDDDFRRVREGFRKLYL